MQANFCVELRDYQNKLLSDTLYATHQNRRVLAQCPTGGGKTVVATALTGLFEEIDHKVFFVCHRAELVHQSSLTFAAAGVQHSFVAAGRDYDPAASVFICSIDTLKSRLAKVAVVPDLVIWDECHHVGAAGWTAVMQHYPNALHVGLSATPVRLDGRGLDAHFDVLVQGPSTAWLIEQGFLSPYRAFAPSKPDLSGVHSAMGDFKQDELEDAVNKPQLIGDAVEHWKRHAQGLRTVAFAVTVKHSLAVVDAFNAAGIQLEEAGVAAA